MAYVKDSDLMNYLVYFDQKSTAWNNDHFVAKKDGMSLISDTTLTAITNHLAEVEGDATVPGGAADSSTITAALDDYFANKTATLTGGGA